jgi:hypothetical protein
VFFVKTFEGDPQHVQRNAFDGEPKVGRCLWVDFSDGEGLAGRATAFREENGGFFLFPNDPQCNFERAWIVLDSTRRVVFDEEASEAAANHVPVLPPTAGRPAPDAWAADPGPARSNGPSPKSASSSSVRPASRQGADDLFLGDW